MKDHQEYEELAAIYALGALGEPERQRLESHLAEGCGVCLQAVGEASQVAGELALALTPVAPSPSVKARLMQRVREDRDQDFQAIRPRSAIWVPLAAAAALVVAVALGFYARSLSRRLESERSVRMELERELGEIQRSVDVYTGPRTQAVALAGQGPAPGARARAFLDPDRRQLFLYVYNLPPPPPGRTYQLWVIVGKQAPLSAGTFEVAADGTARLDAEPLPAFEGLVTVAVTEEPSGGVPQPTGPMVLLGS